MKKFKFSDIIRGIFKYNKNIRPPEERPAYITEYKPDNTGYYAGCRDAEKYLSDLIINKEKEVKRMDVKAIIAEQLKQLETEKADLVKQVVEAEKEKIEAIKAEAAAQAETAYVANIETKVVAQFRVAEEHLNKLLANIPAEEKIEKSEEIEQDTAI